MENNKDRNVYIVLTYTGTIMAKIVKFYTRKEFSHVSLSLDEDLEEMYSFGRLNPYNPFCGGFVHEGIDIGTFKRFKNTKSAIYSLKLTEEQYDKINLLIEEMKKKQESYKFNCIGLFAVAINYKYQKENRFYCAEFVKYLLDNAGVEIDVPELVKPMDFKYIEDLNLEYKGMLRDYKTINNH